VLSRAIGHPGAKPDRAKRLISSLESTMSNRIAPKLLAEFIGTFSFVFIGAGAAGVVGGGAMRISALSASLPAQ
jgi:hypothetical protein